MNKSRKIIKPAALKNGGLHPLGVTYSSVTRLSQKKKVVKKSRKKNNG